MSNKQGKNNNRKQMSFMEFVKQQQARSHDWVNNKALAEVKKSFESATDQELIECAATFSEAQIGLLDDAFNTETHEYDLPSTLGNLAKVSMTGLEFIKRHQSHQYLIVKNDAAVKQELNDILMMVSDLSEHNQLPWFVTTQEEVNDASMFGCNILQINQATPKSPTQIMTKKDLAEEIRPLNQMVLDRVGHKPIELSLLALQLFDFKAIGDQYLKDYGQD